MERFAYEEQQRIVATIRKEQEAHDLRLRENGRIYFLRATDGLRAGQVKIGKTLDLQARLRTLRRDFGECELLLTLCGYTNAERQLHLRFAEERHAGSEWFEFSSRLAEFIESVNARRVAAA